MGHYVWNKNNKSEISVGYYDLWIFINVIKELKII